MMWKSVALRVLVEALLRTLRIDTSRQGALDALLAAGKPFVLIFWHGSMLLPWWVLRRQGAAALVSQSADGELLARLLQGWGYTVVRGSSSRGSKEAMASMRELVRGGHVLCVTPDGPRGPQHELKMGAVRVAQTMGVPLLGVAVGYRSSRQLRSWDRFLIPSPFTRSRLLATEPLVIDPALDGEALEARRQEIEKLLVALHREAVLCVPQS
ncbi:MAG: lysophospholipid acyltransferase family protein [Ignavibacteria bacterium]|nr:lysophospholipid acyltransferase family protein [Ignavibacteria bacterium]